MQKKTMVLALLLSISSLLTTADTTRSGLDLADIDITSCASNDRECLYAFIDLYLEALVNGDPSSLPVSGEARFTENDKVLALGEGLWAKGVRGLGSYQIYSADTRTGQAGFIGVVDMGDLHSLFSVRLRIRDHEITQIETLVPGRTLAGFMNGRLLEAAAGLVTARPGYRVPLRPGERVSREKMRDAADSYYDGVEKGNGDVVAFADQCHRVENGIALVNNPDVTYPTMVTKEGEVLDDFAGMPCREQFDTRVWATDSISDRRYPLIDEQYGIVFAYTLYHRFSKDTCVNLLHHGRACVPEGENDPFTLILLEAFKIRSGKIHEMESVWTILPDNRADSAW